MRRTDGAETQRSELDVISSAVAWLFWGALLFSVSFVPIAFLGMVLVTVGCAKLRRIGPVSPLGTVPLVLATVVTLSVVGLLFGNDPTLVSLLTVLSATGGAAVTWQLAWLVRAADNTALFQRWHLAAKWQTALVALVVFVLATSAMIGDQDTNGGQVLFDWAITNPAGAVLLTVTIAVPVLAVLFWFSAARLTWRSAPRRPTSRTADSL